MEKPDRTKSLNILNHQWGNYVQAYQDLSESDKRDFLTRQGYIRFADLLAHVSAWWKMGMKTIEIYKVNPEYDHPSIDVNIFNAKAVARIQHLPEAKVIANFEKTRRKFVDYITTQLTDEDFENPKIQWQLNMELFGHYDEHKL